jgi:predicted DNA-binding transcriptional regulator
MINQLLNELGFSDKETAVYLCILRNGAITPANVARLTRINRTTVYAVAKELLARGVISQDLASKTGHLLALPPAELGQLAIREEQALARKREIIAKAVTELQETAKDVRYSIPKITFITEDDLEAYLRRQTPVWNQSMAASDGILWAYQDGSFVEHYSEWIEWYWQHPSSKKIDVRVLTDHTPKEEELATKGYGQRKVKFWKESHALTATTWVMGSYMTLIQTTVHPYYLIDIRDTTIAANQQALFRSLWDSIS